MEVEFADNALAECYWNRSAAVRRWGPAAGTRFGRVIDALYSAADRLELGAIRSLRLHPLHGPRQGQWALVLHDRWRVVVTFEEDTVRVEEVAQHYGD
jgi:plasmid maintenance system killer protein